jgi:hypothetical protein
VQLNSKMNSMKERKDRTILYHGSIIVVLALSGCSAEYLEGVRERSAAIEANTQHIIVEEPYRPPQPQRIVVEQWQPYRPQPITSNIPVGPLPPSPSQYFLP